MSSCFLTIRRSSQCILVPFNFMIKPYTHWHPRIYTMASIKSNSHTIKRSRALALFCLINSNAVALMGISRSWEVSKSSKFCHWLMPQRISTKNEQKLQESLAFEHICKIKLTCSIQFVSNTISTSQKIYGGYLFEKESFGMD